MKKQREEREEEEEEVEADDDGWLYSYRALRERERERQREALAALSKPGACIFQRTSLPVAGMYGNGTVIITSHVVIPGTVTGTKATVAGDFAQTGR